MTHKNECLKKHTIRDFWDKRPNKFSTCANISYNVDVFSMKTQESTLSCLDEKYSCPQERLSGIWLSLSLRILESTEEVFKSNLETIFVFLNLVVCLLLFILRLLENVYMCIPCKY